MWKCLSSAHNLFPQQVIKKHKDSIDNEIKKISAQWSIITYLLVCVWQKLKSNLFYYSVYFYYYLWTPLHFLVLFISLTVQFQLTFTLYTVFLTKVFNFSKINGS